MNPLISLIQVIWTEGVGEHERSKMWMADVAAMDHNNEIEGEKSVVVGCWGSRQEPFTAGEHTQL